MLRSTFGRRIVETPASAFSHAAADRQSGGAPQAAPYAASNDPLTEKLRQLGLLAGDPANLGLTPERARAKEDAATAQMDALVAKVNAHIPGVTVIPWAIVPWSVWEGPNAELLISTDFMPSSPWNNLLLPADAQSAEFLGLPEHPRAAIPGLHENLTGMIDEMYAERRDQIEACKAALGRDGWAAIERYEACRNDRFQKLFALARYVASSVFGDEVCARHDELFGIGLAEVTD